MKFKIYNEIFEQFPDLNIGIVVAKGINNVGVDDGVLGFLKKQSEKIRENFNLETLAAIPKIDAWKKAYSFFRANPKKYKSSIENLYRMILEGIELRHINKVVDIYNYISIKHMVPIGGDNLDKIDGDIVLKFAQGNEPFVQLNSKEIANPKKGEIIYTDNKDVLCRRWNWRECDKSKMTEATKNITLVVEGLPPITKNEIELVISELSELVQNICGGKITTYILDSEFSELEI